MSDIDREERIRLRAHQIWERQGRPEGRQQEHWDQARREVEMEEEDAGGLQRTLVETIGLATGVEPAGTAADSAERDAVPRGSTESSRPRGR